MARLKKYPSWLGNAVFYQVYPQSFCDSNSDGIGDLPGLIEKLDYLKDLGISALWLNPVFESPMGDAGYDVSNFRKIAPRYGTNRDACRLFREAHKRGIKIVFDLVAGHTSVEHPWFKNSCRHSKNRYSDYYVWTPDVWTKTVEGKWIRGYAERDGNYLSNFFWFQPALNYGYAAPDPSRKWQHAIHAPGPTAVRKEMKGIAEYWLNKGCDGFRIDMAASLIKNDVDKKAATRFWLEFRRWMEKRYPDAVLIAEWGNPRQAIGAGFHVDFMFHAGEPAHNHLFGTWYPVKGGAREPPVFFERAGRGDIRLFLDNYLEHYKSTAGRGFISLPTGNHDFPRLRRGRSQKELRVIHAMLLTMPGVPFIYYGDEIGMDYLENLPSKEGSYSNRTGSRTPMQWSPGGTKGFSEAPAAKFYLPVDGRKNAPDVASQEADPGSHLNFVRKLISLRKNTPALSNTGEFAPLYAEKGKCPFVYERKTAGERFAVAVNPGSKPRCLALNALDKAVPLLAEGASLEGSTLKMKGVSFGIFKLRKT